MHKRRRFVIKCKPNVNFCNMSIWVSIHIYFLFHIFVYLFCCLPNKLYIIKYIYIYIYIYIYTTHTNIYSHIHTHIYTHKHIHINTHTHTYTHTYTHIHSITSVLHTIVLNLWTSLKSFMAACVR